MPRRVAAVLIALILSTGLAAQSPQPILRSTTQEVLLDFIARDKHQKLVPDLRPEDIEILEDGVPQRIRSFQYHHGRDQSGPRSTAAPQPAGGSAKFAALREINVVSLVFEALDAQSRRSAQQAAKDFLASEVNPDTYIAVFTLNHRLSLLQQYTNDLDLLNRAVDRASGGAYQEFANNMEKEVMKLNSISGGANGRFQPIRPGSAEERGPIAADSGHAPFLSIEQQMAALTISIIANQAGNQSIDALQDLIRMQAQLPGRKTIIYFSPSLIVPPEQPELFRAVISAANRANVTFYAVDPSGLDTMSRARVAEATTRAINTTGFGGTDVQATNYQENLRTLAEDTGGFLIANSNDMRVPLRRVMEEVRAHYEVAYSPTSSKYDGHFRTIELKSRRAGVHLQGRKGYFALPVLDGESLAAFELPALNALDAQPAPHGFDFHSGMLAFRTGGDATDYQTVFSVPSRSLHFTDDAHSKLFRVHVSFLGLVKDEQGQVVSKVSRDVQFQAPAAKRAEFERGEVIVNLPLRLPPGLYHVETVAVDQDGSTASVRRLALDVPHSVARLSDLVLVRSISPAGPDRDVMDPLEFSGGKVTPEIDSTKAAEGVYFVLYPGADASPDVRIAILHNGAVAVSAHAELPPAESDGSLRIFSPIRFSSFDPGVYEIAVTSTQGGVTVRRMTVVEVR